MSTQTALVWGAAGGIGRALTHRLVADKWQVVSLGRHTETLQDLTPYVFECEVTDPFAVQRTVIAAGQEVSEASLFVYSVGDITSATVATMPPAAWERIIGANLTGAFLTAHYCMPLLADDAPLVFVGAVSERLRLPGLSAYAAAKAGMEAFVEVLRKEQRHRQVLLVRPAAVTTALWHKVPFKMPAKALSPEEVAERIIHAYHEGRSETLDL